MFTGLVQDVGTLVTLGRQAAAVQLDVRSRLAPFAVGESIAVMGACLTVTAARGDVFSAFASPETLSRTGFARLVAGSSLNLERAVRLGEPLGGHLVTGHVDTRVRLLSRTPESGAERLRLALPPAPWSRQLAAKGSVTLDGVSLTINEVDEDAFTVTLIPQTLSTTTLGRLGAGDDVNLETDVLAKYVARQLGGPRDDTGDGVTLELLSRAGFLR